MSKSGDKTVVSGPPKAPVALLDKLRSSLESRAARRPEPISQFLLEKLNQSGVASPEMLEALEETGDGPYLLERQLAEGGMGAILTATDQNLRRTVALKVILSGADADPDMIQRLITEARITGQLQHPNIVPLYDLGVTGDGVVYYTMQLVQGITLNDVLEKIRDGDEEMLKQFPLPALLTAFQKVCDAVAYAHSRGVVHRDLKPDNIMLGEFGEVMVMDWGLAKLLVSDEECTDTEFLVREEENLIDDNSYQTLSGAIKGTPRYMAPEQALSQADEIDERTDVYALGAILYAILTLHAPVGGATVDEVLKNVATGAIASPTDFNTHATSTISAREREEVEKPISPPALEHCPDRKVPASLSAVAMKALGRRKKNRYHSVSELQRELEAYQRGFATSAEEASPFRMVWLMIQRHRTESLLIAAALSTIVVLVAWFTSRISLALDELKETAPAFYTEARTLTEEVKFARALARINYALTLQPEDARFHALKGNIHQSLYQFEQAVESYKSAQLLDPDLPYLEENRELSVRLRNERRLQGAASTNLLNELRLSLQKQGRRSESIVLNTRLSPDKDDVFLSWKQLVFKAGLRGRLLRMPDERLNLKINNPESSDLESLRAMPISHLDASGTRVRDLAPLRDLKLVELRLNSTKVSDISPVDGLPLKVVDLGGTLIESVESLGQSPLEQVDLSGTAVEDISPIIGNSLRELRVADCAGLTDLTVLTNCPQLERLIAPAELLTESLLNQLPRLKKVAESWPEGGWREAFSPAEYLEEIKVSAAAESSDQSEAD